MYDAEAPRPGHVRVTATVASGVGRGRPGERRPARIDPARDRQGAGVALERFVEAWNTAWVPSEVVLTSRAVILTPRRTAPGATVVTVPLSSISRVEVSGRIAGVAGLRTQRHLLQVRMAGAQAFGQAVADLIRAARRV